MANTFTIDLTVSGDNFYDDPGANIKTETAIVAAVRYETVPETRTFIINIDYWISAQARQITNRKTGIHKFAAGQLTSAPARMAESVNQNTFSTATPTVALQFIKTKLEEFFGANSVTIT